MTDDEDDEVAAREIRMPGTCYRRAGARCVTDDDCLRPSLSVVARDSLRSRSRKVRAVDEGPCVFYSADHLHFRGGAPLAADDLRDLKGLRDRVVEGRAEPGSEEEEGEAAYRHGAMALRHNRVFRTTPRGPCSSGSSP